MVSQRIMTFTKLALAEFVDTYGDLKEKRGFEGPSPDDLFEMMAEEITGETLTMKQCKPRVEDVAEPAKAVEEDAVSVGNEEEQSVEKVTTPAPVVEEAPTPQATEEAPAPTQAQKKIPAKDLKKLTVKQTKTVQKGEHKGETKEVDVMVELPYLPHCVDYSDTCQAIVCNGGLMTPCLTRPAKGSSYCRICSKGLKYGTLADREAAPVGTYEVTCESGEKSQVKREITYGTWLMKRSMERSYVETLLQEKFGDAITIPESYFEVNKSKARRGVKKSPSVSSDGETSSVEEETSSVQSAENVQKKRGRPKKEKPANAEEKPKKRRGRPAAPKKPVVEEETLESLEASEPEKEAATPPPAPIAEEEEVQNTVVEKANAPEQEPVAEPEPVAEAEPEPEPTPVEKPTTPVETDELDEDEISDDDSDEEGEETHIMYKGKNLCYDEENVLYLIENDEPTIVGTWDPETEKPVFQDGVNI
jgi:hypothetical protein